LTMSMKKTPAKRGIERAAVAVRNLKLYG